MLPKSNINANQATRPLVWNAVLPARYASTMVAQRSWEWPTYIWFDLRATPWNASHLWHCQHYLGTCLSAKGSNFPCGWAHHWHIIVVDCQSPRWPPGSLCPCLHVFVIFKVHTIVPAFSPSKASLLPDMFVLYLMVAFPTPYPPSPLCYLGISTILSYHSPLLSHR